MPILPSASSTRSRRRWYIALSSSIVVLRAEHGLDRGVLDRGEDAGVDVALHGAERLDRLGVAAANATRQPVMLYALEQLNSSMATSLAPGRSRKLGAL